MQNSDPTTTKTRLPPDESASRILAEAGDIKEGDDNIYLPLDAILDTRMGTLAKMGTEHAVRVLNTGKYHNRVSDIFEGVNKEDFREAYANRDIVTLKLSVVTNLVYFLRRIIKDSLISSVINQKVEKICFTVNVYPYDFEDVDLVEMLVGCIRFHTYSTATVKIISVPEKELTPEFCGRNFQIMIMYDWVNWVDKHRKFFETKGIPGTSLVVPEMFFDEEPTQEDIDRLNMHKHNPFRMNEEISKAMFRLKYMPASLFSMHESITKKNAGEIANRAAITEADIKTYLSENYPKATLTHDTPLPGVNLDEAFELL